MKKIIFIILFIFIVVMSVVNTYAGDQLKLFYNENFIDLSQEIIAQGNEYFVNAKELTAVTGINCKIDPSKTSMTLKIDNSVKYFEIKYYDYTLLDSSAITHNAPELINDKVYFPFSLLKQLYNVTIKYDKAAKVLYFFPGNGKIKTFSNKKYNYNLDIPDNLYLKLDQSYNVDISAITLVNEDNTFSSSIIYDQVNKTALRNMRFLLSDYTSSNDYIFNRIVEYKQSYFRSLLDSYKNEFLFGNLDKALSESNIKIIKDYSQKLFGQDANVILFNTISSNKYTSMEDTNIIITIPSYVNESIYSLTFKMKTGALNDSNVKNITQILKGLTIINLSKQENAPEVLYDYASIIAANNGIYPSLPESEINYTVLEDSPNLYSIKYPSNYIPYLQNNFIDNYGYRSFKVNHNNLFSITAEHLPGSSERILEKINTLKSYYSDKIKVISVESKKINNKEFIEFNYEIDNTNSKEFVTDYFITNGPRLYTLELNSLVSKPSASIFNEFFKIVASFEFTTPENSNATTSKKISYIKFANDREGYSIFYPDDWSIQDNSQDINYDSFEITNPNFSGPLNIVINESEYTSKLTVSELLRFTNGYNSSNLNKYFKNYKTPYKDKKFKVLKSSITTYKDMTMISRLVNYLDEGDRYKQCYSIDLIKNNKINSLYISASDYLFLDGVLADKDLNHILDYMSESFRKEDSEKHQVRLLSTEKRNQKIVFIENFFKKALGETATITFAKNLSSEKDVLVYLNNCNKAGAYRLNFDYNSKKIQVSCRVLNSEIVKSAEKKMRDLLKGKYIHEISVNSDDMTISVKYSDSSLSAIVNRTYYIQVTPSKKDYSIDFARQFDTKTIKEECQNFLENYLLSAVQIYFPANYSYSNETSNKYYYEKRSIPVYAEFDGQSGYFYLEVDPVKDSVKIINSISNDALKERIKEHYIAIDPSSEVSDCQRKTTDKFCFNVTISSQTNKLSKQTIYLYFDEENQDLILSPKDLYFFGVIID